MDFMKGTADREGMRCSLYCNLHGVVAAAERTNTDNHTSPIRGCTHTKASMGLFSKQHHEVLDMGFSSPCAKSGTMYRCLPLRETAAAARTLQLGQELFLPLAATSF